MQDGLGPCRVVVISANPIVVAGTTALLQEHPDLDVTHHRGGPEDAPPHDVVLYDVTQATQEAAELDRWIDAGAPVVAMARDLRPGLDPAIRPGVVASLSLSADGAHLAAALVTASRDPRSRAERHAQPADPAPTAVDGLTTGRLDLTPREAEIMAYIASGWSNQEIAQRLYLSINTVKTYIRYAYRKLGISRRSQAVLWCLAHGVTTDEDPP